MSHGHKRATMSHCFCGFYKGFRGFTTETQTVGQCHLLYCSQRFQKHRANHKVIIKINKSLFQQNQGFTTFAIVSLLHQLSLVHKLNSASEGKVLCACLGNSQGISGQKKTLANNRSLNAWHIRIRAGCIDCLLHMLPNSQK